MFYIKVILRTCGSKYLRRMEEMDRLSHTSVTRPVMWCDMTRVRECERGYLYKGEYMQATLISEGGSDTVDRGRATGPQ